MEVRAVFVFFVISMFPVNTEDITSKYENKKVF